MKKESFNNVNLLKICNNERLKTIEIEDGEVWNEDGQWNSNGAFRNVVSVEMNSISRIIVLVIIRSS